jgi:hypothetical protein
LDLPRVLSAAVIKPLSGLSAQYFASFSELALNVSKSMTGGSFSFL